MTAHLFQARVKKRFDVRVTVVGEQVFATEIHNDGPGGGLDWRSNHKTLDYRPCSIPDEVETGIHRLMAMLDLRFGALDFIVTPEGQWVFLEINPNGQWAWIERATGQPVSAAMAELLRGVA